MKKRCIKLVAILLTCAISIVSAVTAVAYSFDIPFKKEYNLFLSEYLINEDPFAQRLISGEIQAPCRLIVELKKDDPQWNWDVKAWTNATMDLSDYASSTAKSIAFYETILFDVFCDSQESEESITDLLAASQAAQLEVSNEVISTYGDVMEMSLEAMKKNADLYAKISNTIKKSESLKNAFKVLDKYKVFDMAE